jgi:hypothetical protein
MARGWESKAVEAQIETAAEQPGNGRNPSTPEDADANRKKESLLLSRKRVVQQLENSSNPRYKQMMEAALAELDAQLKGLK